MRVSGGGVTADYTQPRSSACLLNRFGLFTAPIPAGYHSFENDEIGDQIQLFDVEDQ